MDIKEPAGQKKKFHNLKLRPLMDFWPIWACLVIQWGQSVKNLLAGEDMEKLDHSYMLVAMYNDTATLGKFGNFLSQ